MLEGLYRWTSEPYWILFGENTELVGIRWYNTCGVTLGDRMQRETNIGADYGS